MHYKKSMRIFAVLLLALSSTGCGTLFNSHLKPVTFNSEPEGANVYVDGNRVGKTPCEVDLDKHDSLTVTFKKEGYEEKTTLLQSNVQPGLLIADLLSLVGLVVDAATRNWNDLQKGDVSVELDQK